MSICRLCEKLNVYIPDETPEEERCQCVDLPLEQCSVCGESRSPLVLFAGICGMHALEHKAKVRVLTPEQIEAMRRAETPKSDSVQAA